MNNSECQYTSKEAHMPVVIMLDDLVHTDEQPYCEDVTCPCQAERENPMSTHEQVTQANQEANKLWEAVPAWPVDGDGQFLRDDVALVDVVLQVVAAVYIEPAASK